MLKISESLSIPESEITYKFFQSSGPGGQNVNKVATSAQLNFNVVDSPSLPEGIKRNLYKVAGKRMTSQGILIIHARRFRNQEKNRLDAEARLITLIHKAMHQPKKRIPTQPGKAASEKRLKIKKLRAENKKLRKGITSIEE